MRHVLDPVQADCELVWASIARWGLMHHLHVEAKVSHPGAAVQSWITISELQLNMYPHRYKSTTASS